jgi:hypothetical protein
MPITYTPIGGESGQSRSLSIEANGKRAYTAHWRAETGNSQVGAKAVEGDFPVKLGMTYAHFDESDDNSYAQRVTVSEDTAAGDGCQWVITVEYGPANPLEFTPQDPMIERPKISFASNQFQVPVTVTIEDGEEVAVVNSAGDAFNNPPVLVDQPRLLMTITRNEPAYDPLLANDLHNAINSTTWFGLPALVWKCLNITGEQATDANGDRYWVVTYQFELNRETWLVLVLDQGMREINAAGKKVAITDDKGQFVDEPWPLNADGSKKATGQAGEFLEFHVYPEIDFSIFNLDAFHQDLITAGLLL